MVSSVVDTWTRAGFKIIAIHHVRTHIINYINKYMAVRKSRYKDGPGTVRARDAFSEKMKGKGRHTKKVFFSGLRV